MIGGGNGVVAVQRGVDMSFDIQWDTICNDEELAQSFQDFLNSKLVTLELPHYLANLQVVDFKFGDAAPDITIRDVDVPFKEFYVPTEDDSEVSDESSQFEYTNNESTKNDDVMNKTHTEKHEPLNPSRSSSPNPFIKNHNTLLMPRRTNSGFVPTVGYSGIGLNGFGMNQANNNNNRADSMDSENEYFQPSSDENGNGDQEIIFSNLADGMTGLNLQNHSNNDRGNIDHFSGVESTSNEFNRKVSNNYSNPQVNTLYSSDESESPVDSRIDSLDIQLSIDLHWNSHLYIEIICDLLVNYPAPNFIRLPVRLKITDLKIHSLMVVACISKRVFISFLCDIESDDEETDNNGISGANNNATDSRQDSHRSTTTSTATPATKRTKGKERIDILQDMKIEGEIGNVSESAELWRENLLKPLQEKQQKQGGSTMKKNNDLDVGSGSNFLSGIVNNDDIGDGNGLVLRNIGKIEKFLMNAFRDLMIDELAWPGWIELDFNETTSDGEGGSEGELEVFDDPEGTKMQRTHSTLPNKSGRTGNKSEDRLGIRSIRSVRSVSTEAGRRPVSIAADSVYSSDSYFTSDEE